MTVVAESLACAAGRRTVLTDVSLEIGDGEVVGIVGPNGSGKSTLIATLAGARRPVSGSVTVGGFSIHRASNRVRARTVALVGQDDDVPADLSVGEVVSLGRTPYLPPWGVGSPRERAGVESALATVDLVGFADRPVTHVSGGELRRVLLARALVQDTPLLFLDEPTNHLDVRHQLHLMDIVRGLGRTTVMALHDLSLARRVCDRILVLDSGRALPLLEPDRALTADVVERVFGVTATPVVHPATGVTHLLFTPIQEPE